MPYRGGGVHAIVIGACSAKENTRFAAALPRLARGRCRLQRVDSRAPTFEWIRKLVARV